MSSPPPAQIPLCSSGACAIGLEEDDPVAARRIHRRWWGIGIGAVLAGNAMMFELAINTSGADPWVIDLMHWLLLGATLVTGALLGPALAAGAWRELRRGRITIELLFVSGLAGAFTASMIAMATGRGPAYFETVIILLVVYALGHQLTEISQRRALRSIESWRGAPETCEVLGPDGAAIEREVAAVAVGESVRVHPGRAIPVDGTILAGEALVQQSQLTGEFFAERRGPGEPVFAGSHCLDGTLEVRATSPGDARRIDRLARAVEVARATPSRLVTEADRLVRWFLPVVLGLAAVTFAGWTVAAGWRTGLLNAMAVLLVACPCAMGFAAPVSVWSVLGRLAMGGLTPQRGDAVERLAEIDTAVFDKTGTLTEGRATLVDLALAPVSQGLGAADLRAAIGAVQRASDHPVAAAFAGLEPDAVAVRGVRLLPGRGVVAECESRGKSFRLTIGSEAVLEAPDQRTEWQAIRSGLAGLDRGRPVVVLADGRPVAGAVVDERPLASAPVALAGLRELGAEPILMTGDAAARATGFGIGEVHAGLTPEGKQALVRDLRGRGRHVLFVGDGVNDAIAMAEASVAIAMGGGAELATGTADLVLEGGDLARLPEAVALCRRARRTIRGNLRLAAGYNTAGMALAAAGVLGPVTAAILMTCSSLVVTWRALRLLEDPPGNPAGEDLLAPSDTALIETGGHA